ncbi:MAG: hypothetical protein ABJN69_17415 [Hellea sp.]
MDNDIGDIKEANAQASMRDVSFDELLDDTVGLSFKSVRSIWFLFKNPRLYFTAAKAPFWQNRFSPSFRIYAGLIAISTGMKFLYRDESSPMVQVYKQQFEMIKTDIANRPDPSDKLNAENMDSTVMAITTLKWYILIAPLAMVFTFCLLGLLYRGFGEKLNPVVRIRYVFATMIPASIVSLLLILPMYFSPPQFTGYFSFLGLGLMFGMLWITAYRGAFPAVATPSGRAGRATALSALIIFFMLASAMVAAVVGVVFAMKDALT